MAISPVSNRALPTTAPTQSTDLADQVIAGLTGTGKTYAQLEPGSVPGSADGFDNKSGAAPSGSDPKQADAPATKKAHKKHKAHKHHKAHGHKHHAKTDGKPATKTGSTSNNPIKADLDKLMKDLVGQGEKFADKFVGNLGKTAENFADGLVSKAGGAAEKFADGLVGKALSGLESLPFVGGLIKNFEPQITGAADGLINKGVTALEGAADGLIGKGVQAGENLVDGLVGKAGSAIEGAADGVINKVGDWLGSIF